MIGADYNGHVGEGDRGDENVMEGMMKGQGMRKDR